MTSPMQGTWGTLGHQARHNYEHPVLDSITSEEGLAAERAMAVEMWRRYVPAGRVLGEPDLVELRPRAREVPPGGAPMSRVFRVEGPVLTADVGQVASGTNPPVPPVVLS